jgi:hypothetical protein
LRWMAASRSNPWFGRSSVGWTLERSCAGLASTHESAGRAALSPQARRHPAPRQPPGHRPRANPGDWIPAQPRPVRDRGDVLRVRQTVDDQRLEERGEPRVILRSVTRTWRTPCAEPRPQESPDAGMCRGGAIVVLAGRGAGIACHIRCRSRPAKRLRW